MSPGFSLSMRFFIRNYNHALRNTELNVLFVYLTQN
jgi:hypothetical protein